MYERCQAIECERSIPPGMVLCPQHRAMLPATLVAVIDMEDASVPLPAWVLESLVNLAHEPREKST